MTMRPSRAKEGRELLCVGLRYDGRVVRKERRRKKEERESVLKFA